MKAGFYVDAWTSKTFQRVNKCKPVRLTWGPYKRIETAKRKATWARKKRAIFDVCDGRGYVDFGPTYGSVRVFEVTKEVTKEDTCP